MLKVVASSGFTKRAQARVKAAIKQAKNLPYCREAWEIVDDLEAESRLVLKNRPSNKYRLEYRKDEEGESFSGL
jgi:hypothetical protein